jgi:hypothetical protein
MKNCTPEQKASCAHGDKAKAEAAATPAGETKVDAKANGN